MFDYRIGMIGTPAVPDVKWSDSKLEELKQYGFNMMQLNIAWGCRPNDEPLNLQDVLVLPEQDSGERRKAEERRGRIRMRLELCKKQGMRSLFHFGAPYNGLEPYQGVPPKVCFHTEDTVKYYCGLLEELERQIPGIDDILVYTYDQDAWLCSEFSHCENCRGIPLHKRLPGFLSALSQKWNEVSGGGRMWWESWELSAGQTLKTIEQLPEKGFGLMIHSNIGEVQKTRTVDTWFQNVCMLAEKKHIPVIAELFLGESSEETEPLKRIPCPSLTYMQIKKVICQTGVAGIKEYYGLLPQTGDPCLEIAGQVICHPEKSLEECLDAIAGKYERYKNEVIQFWQQVSEAYMLYPWDVSWYARECGRSTTDHGWNAAFLRGQQCSTPSWESTRHAVFMKTDDHQPHPWMLEDVGLRFEMAGERMQKAYELGAGLLEMIPEKMRDQIEESLESIETFRRICTAYYLHIRETNVAMMLREEAERPTKAAAELKKEMMELLCADEKNQEGRGRVVKIRREFEENPEQWLAMYLLPVVEDLREKGYYALTTR